MKKQDEIGGDTAKAVAKHTPGPWTINNSMSGTYVYQGDSENCIAEVFADVHEDQDANARLIASAPDLLAVLNHLNAPERRRFLTLETQVMISDAIAKASEQQ